MANEILKPSFDPSFIPIIPHTDVKKANKTIIETNDKLTKIQRERFDEIVKELEENFKEIGMEPSFSSDILISQVAMNLIVLEKVLLQSQIMPFLYVIHKDVVLVKKDVLNSEYTPMNKEYDIHPYFEKMFFRLQNQINDGLKKLGLLPMQQIEKQKLTIIKKLKQRCAQIEKEYSIKAEKEIVGGKKKEGSGKNREGVCVEAEQIKEK